MNCSLGVVLDSYVNKVLSNSLSDIDHPSTLKLQRYDKESRIEILMSQIQSLMSTPNIGRQWKLLQLRGCDSIQQCNAIEVIETILRLSDSRYYYSWSCFVNIKFMYKSINLCYDINTDKIKIGLHSTLFHILNLIIWIMKYIVLERKNM